MVNILFTILYSHFIEPKKRKNQKGRLSLWDTNPWGNFWHPHWELIWCNKLQPETLGISTSPEIGVGTHFHVQHDTKTSRLLQGSLVSLRSGSTMQRENTYSCIFKVTGQVWERQKRIAININLGDHQHSLP